MTTEQMDWLDDERAGRHQPPTIDNRQAVLDHIADLADDKMVQIRVDQLRAMVTGYDDLRTTTEKEADDNSIEASVARLRAARQGIAEGMGVPVEVLDADDYVTQAEEPIESRLQRAYMNGFKDGADRASYGRWDR